ncbi:MAG TPA: ABC transporter ATP-binding protein [Candidatus Thermoplasmatota archaeon]|nr:ABC transporter ATP-binding protein [Candidatus Thermoplasmatota archaeon]
MLVASGLGKRYGAVVAVDGVDLEVPAGRIVGLVGNNGAGKTTTLKMLCGVLEPTSGAATVAGRSTLEAEARRAIGFLPEDSPLYDDQTPQQYLAFFARLYGLDRKQAQERAGTLLRDLRLDPPYWTRPIGQLSKGSARKVAIARALLHDPAVLILDEPASGLDPATRRELDLVLSDLRKQGKAILLSAHNLKQVEELCDDIVLLHAGKVAGRGSLADLRKQMGEPRYRLHASHPFPGSAPRGSIHVGEFSRLADVERAMEAVRAAGGSVLDLESLPPTLDDILRKVTGAAT